MPAAVREEVETTGLRLLTVIPDDPHVAGMDAGGKTANDIPADSPARLAVNSLMEDWLAGEATRDMPLLGRARLNR